MRAAEIITQLKAVLLRLSFNWLGGLPDAPPLC